MISGPFRVRRQEQGCPWHNWIVCTTDATYAWNCFDQAAVSVERGLLVGVELIDLGTGEILDSLYRLSPPGDANQNPAGIPSRASVPVPSGVQKGRAA